MVFSEGGEREIFLSENQCKSGGGLQPSWESYKTPPPPPPPPIVRQWTLYGQHAYLDIRAGIPEAGTDKPLIPDLARPYSQPSIAESEKRGGGGSLTALNSPIRNSFINVIWLEMFREGIGIWVITSSIYCNGIPNSVVMANFPGTGLFITSTYPFRWSNTSLTILLLNIHLELKVTSGKKIYKRKSSFNGCPDMVFSANSPAVFMENAHNVQFSLQVLGQ